MLFIIWGEKKQVILKIDNISHGHLYGGTGIFFTESVAEPKFGKKFRAENVSKKHIRPLGRGSTLLEMTKKSDIFNKAECM